MSRLYCDRSRKIQRSLSGVGKHWLVRSTPPARWHVAQCNSTYLVCVTTHKTTRMDCESVSNNIDKRQKTHQHARDLRDTRLQGKGSLRPHFKWSDSQISSHRYCWTSHRLSSKETVIMRRWGREKRNLVKIELQKLTFRAFVLRLRYQ